MWRSASTAALITRLESHALSWHLAGTRDSQPSTRFANRLPTLARHSFHSPQRCVDYYMIQRSRFDCRSTATSARRRCKRNLKLEDNKSAPSNAQHARLPPPPRNPASRRRHRSSPKGANRGVQISARRGMRGLSRNTTRHDATLALSVSWRPAPIAIAKADGSRADSRRSSSSAATSDVAVEQRDRHEAAVATAARRSTAVATRRRRRVKSGELTATAASRRLWRRGRAL